VILGAGYDSRPYRFADRLAGVQVFEVDHPATSTSKQAKIGALFGKTPANVAYRLPGTMFRPAATAG